MNCKMHKEKKLDLDLVKMRNWILELENSNETILVFSNFLFFAFVVKLFLGDFERQARNLERVNHAEGRLKAGQNIP